MNASERIAEKKKKIETSKEKIAKEQEKIKKLTAEIEEIESLEVKGLLKELDMPISELKDFIKKLSANSNTTSEASLQENNNQD